MNRREIEKAKKQLVVDQREVEDYKMLVAEMNAIILPEDRVAFRSLNARIIRVMAREHIQATTKLAQAGAGVRQGRRELRDEYQEAQMTGELRDRMEARDDARDLRADKFDRMSAAARAARMKAIIQECDGLYNMILAGETDALPRDRHLAGEFLELMQADIRATEAELFKDKHERHEDRLEQRVERRR
jgi:hypothetical protein